MQKSVELAMMLTTPDPPNQGGKNRHHGRHPSSKRTVNSLEKHAGVQRNYKIYSSDWPALECGAHPARNSLQTPLTNPPLSLDHCLRQLVNPCSRNRERPTFAWRPALSQAPHQGRTVRPPANPPSIRSLAGTSCNELAYSIFQSQSTVGTWESPLAHPASRTPHPAYFKLRIKPLCSVHMLPPSVLRTAANRIGLRAGNFSIRNSSSLHSLQSFRTQVCGFQSFRREVCGFQSRRVVTLLKSVRASSAREASLWAGSPEKMCVFLLSSTPPFLLLPNVSGITECLVKDYLISRADVCIYS